MTGPLVVEIKLPSMNELSFAMDLPSMALILEATADEFSTPRTPITKLALISNRRDRPTAQARQVAMYLAHTRTLLSTTQIGLLLGKRDHTTVMHGSRRVRERMDESPAFRARVNLLADALSRPASTTLQAVA